MKKGRPLKGIAVGAFASAAITLGGLHFNIHHRVDEMLTTPIDTSVTLCAVVHDDKIYDINMSSHRYRTFEVFSVSANSLDREEIAIKNFDRLSEAAIVAATLCHSSRNLEA